MPCLHSKFFPGTPAIWGLCWCKVSVCHHVGRESPTFSFTSSISGNVQGIRAETGTGGPGGHVDFAMQVPPGLEVFVKIAQAGAKPFGKLGIVSVVRSRPESQIKPAVRLFGVRMVQTSGKHKNTDRRSCRQRDRNGRISILSVRKVCGEP